MTRELDKARKSITTAGGAPKRPIAPLWVSVSLLPWISVAAYAASTLSAPDLVGATGIKEETLRWTPVAGATSYTVHIHTINGQGVQLPPLSVGNKTELPVRNLQPGVQYAFTVTADSNGTSSNPSLPVYGIPESNDTARVTDLHYVVVGSSSVKLIWTDIGATSYEIDEGAEPDITFLKPIGIVSPTGATTLTDTIDLKSGETRYFSIRAVINGVKTSACTPVTVVLSAKKNGGSTANSAPLAFFQTGVSLLNPYHITTTAPVAISPATGTDTNAFLEFFYTNRLAWNQQRMNEKFSGKTSLKPVWNWPWKVWDVQARLGYTFTNSGTKSASTIVGSGNFDGELSVDFPFVAVENAGDVSDYTVAPILGYTAVTDRSALRSHQSYFGGISYATSLEDPLGDKNASGAIRRILLEFRLVYARLDTIRYVSSSSTEIYTTNGTLPRYFSKWSPGFESELLYPLNKTSYVTFRGQIYPDLTPGLWSIQIGFSTPFSKLFGSFFK